MKYEEYCAVYNDKRGGKLLDNVGGIWFGHTLTKEKWTEAAVAIDKALEDKDQEITRLKTDLAITHRVFQERLLDIHKQYAKASNDTLRSYIENLSVVEKLLEPKFKVHQIVFALGRPYVVNSRELKMTVGGTYAWFYTLEYYQGLVHENLLHELTEEEKG